LIEDHVAFGRMNLLEQFVANWKTRLWSTRCSECSENLCCCRKARIVLQPVTVSPKCAKTGERVVDSIRLNCRDVGM